MATKTRVRRDEATFQDSSKLKPTAFKGRFSRDSNTYSYHFLLALSWVPFKRHRGQSVRAESYGTERAALAERELWGYSITTRTQLFVTKSPSPNKHPASPDICFLFLFFTLSPYPNFLPPVGHKDNQNEESPSELSVLRSMSRGRLVILLAGMGESPRTLAGHLGWKAAVFSREVTNILSHFLWTQRLRPTTVNGITKGKPWTIWRGSNLPSAQRGKQDPLPHPQLRHRRPLYLRQFISMQIG